MTSVNAVGRNAVGSKPFNRTCTLIGAVNDYRQVPTGSGKLMACFKLGDLPAKVFGENVPQVAASAGSEKPIMFLGHFDSHGREIEFAVEDVVGAAPPNEDGAYVHIVASK